jgi:hypothetical protein
LGIQRSLPATFLAADSPQRNNNSGSWLTLGIWKFPPTTASASSTIIIKKVKNKTVGSWGRVCASDFDDLTKVVLKGAISEYCTVFICAKLPLPKHVKACDFAAESWVNACGEHGVQI